MRLRSALSKVLFFGLSVALAAPVLLAQDQPATHRGRKYKAPPDTSHIEVEVLKATNGKPLENAAVVFRAVKDGKDEGNLEVKTNAEGRAVIDVIATGSDVQIQVIADGFATFAGDYLINEPTRSIQIKMLKPRAQVSAYQENTGAASQRPLGVQEPNNKPAKPATPPASSTPPSTPPQGGVR